METLLQQNYWHVYSDGKQADIPFCSDDDKIFALNSVAIVAFRTGLTVLCVVVNDTHLHAVLYGTRGLEYKDELRRRLIVYLRHKSKGDKLFFACDEISERRELLSKIIYTFRNCMDFYRKVPWEYRFGPGNVYFAKPRETGKALGELSVRGKKALFHTNVKLPDSWRVDNDGMLVPASFMDIRHVENLFASPKAFLAFLYVRKEDEQTMKQQLQGRYLEERRIQDMRERGNRLSNSYFGKSLIKLDITCRLHVASKMIKEGTGFKSDSFAKALYLKPQDLDNLL